MNNGLIEKVYEVYGNEIPKDRDLFQAKQASPVSMLEIRKSFKNYDNFLAAYMKHCIELRQEEMNNKTIKKEVEDEETE